MLNRLLTVIAAALFGVLLLFFGLIEWSISQRPQQPLNQKSIQQKIELPAQKDAKGTPSVETHKLEEWTGKGTVVLAAFTALIAIAALYQSALTYASTRREQRDIVIAAMSDLPGAVERLRAAPG